MIVLIYMASFYRKSLQIKLTISFAMLFVCLINLLFLRNGEIYKIWLREHSQTTNANTASQKSGIQVMTNLISARQRWADSHYMHHQLNDLGMVAKEGRCC